MVLDKLNLILGLLKVIILPFECIKNSRLGYSTKRIFRVVGKT